jgi:hypothetical protein
LRGREYPFVEYGFTGNASRDVRIFMRAGLKSDTAGGADGFTGATAEAFLAMGLGILAGRAGRTGESISSGKSSSSLKDPEGRGDPDID